MNVKSSVKSYHFNLCQTNGMAEQLSEGRAVGFWYERRPCHFCRFWTLPCPVVAVDFSFLKQQLELLARSFFDPWALDLSSRPSDGLALAELFLHWWNKLGKNVRQVKRSNLVLWRGHLGRVDFEDQTWESQAMLAACTFERSCYWKPFGAQFCSIHFLLSHIFLKPMIQVMELCE